MFLRRLPSAHLTLGVATSRSGRPRRMGTKGENMSLTHVELIGFLGIEPETTFNPNGKAVATLSLAAKTSWMKGDERPGSHRLAPYSVLCPTG